MVSDDFHTLYFDKYCLGYLFNQQQSRTQPNKIVRRFDFEETWERIKHGGCCLDTKKIELFVNRFDDFIRNYSCPSLYCCEFCFREEMSESERETCRVHAERIRAELKFHYYGFPWNRVYGRINVIPECGRAMIDHFQAVFNGKHQVLLDPYATDVCFSGFDRKEKRYKVVFTAIFKKQEVNGRTQSHSEFIFTESDENPNPMIVYKKMNTIEIFQCHLGYANVHRYLLYINGKHVQTIALARLIEVYDPQKLPVTGELDIKFRIGNILKNTKYNFQVIGELSDGTVRYATPRLHFCISESVNGEKVILQVAYVELPSILRYVIKEKKRSSTASEMIHNDNKYVNQIMK